MLPFAACPGIAGDPLTSASEVACAYRSAALTSITGAHVVRLRPSVRSRFSNPDQPRVNAVSVHELDVGALLDDLPLEHQYVEYQ